MLFIMSKVWYEMSVYLHEKHPKTIALLEHHDPDVTLTEHSEHTTAIITEQSYSKLATSSTCQTETD